MLNHGVAELAIGFCCVQSGANEKVPAGVDSCQKLRKNFRYSSPALIVWRPRTFVIEVAMLCEVGVNRIPAPVCCPIIVKPVIVTFGNRV